MTTTTHRRRSLLAALTLLLPALTILASRLLLADRLPPELASHWSSTGAADATMPTGAALALALGLSAAPAAIGVGLAVARRAPRALLGGLGLVAGLGGGTWATSVGTTLSAGSAQEAVLGPWLLALVGGAFFAVVPALIAPATRRRARTAVAGLQLGADETGAWSRTVTGRVFAGVAVVLALTAAAVVPTLASQGAVGPAIAMAVVLGGSSIVLLGFTRLRVTADRRGLRVVSRLLGIPLRRIPLQQIASASTADLRPSEWGGWGYRMRPGGSALILNAGPGLVVTTTARREFAISLRDPETPAALLEALRAR